MSKYFTIFLICAPLLSGQAWAQKAQDFKVQIDSGKLADVRNERLKITLKDAKSDLRRLVQIDREAQNRKQLGGGSNGAGGGGGVACFTAPSAYSREDISSLFVFEAWQWEILKPIKDASTFVDIGSREAPQDYLQRVLQARLSFSAPYFLKILTLAVNEVTSQLNQCRNLTYINDRGIRFTNESEILAQSNCREVQLAWRSPIEKLINGKVKKDFKIEFDCDLYNRMGIKGRSSSIKRINQALLILHEALYLMGARLDSHPNSYNVTNLANYLLSKEVDTSSKVAVRYKLRVEGFGSYFLLLNIDSPISDIKISRQKSYQQAVTILSNIRRLFYSSNFYEFQYNDRDFNNPMYEFSFSIHGRLSALHNHDRAFAAYQILIEQGIPEMTDEEAFIFWLSLLSDETSIDFEAAFLYGVDDTDLIEKACQINQISFSDSYLQSMLAKKITDYCDLLISKPK